MSNIPAETNIPHPVSYEIVIDSVKTESFGGMENIIKSIEFHIKSSHNEKTFDGNNLVLNLEFPNIKNFKEFSKFTRNEVIDMIEERMMDEIVTSKTELNSRYYVITSTYSSSNLPWN